MALTLLTLALVTTSKFVVDPGPAINASFATCTSLCHQTRSCASLFYEFDKKLCYFSFYLYSVPKYGEDLVEDFGNMKYYEWEHTLCNASTGWLYHRPNMICFKFNDFSENHDDAEIECETQGGTLIHTANAVSDEFVRHYSETLDKHLWSGGRLNGSTWLWGGEEEFGNYTNWMDGHPKSGDDCLQIQKDKDTWKSDSCNTKHRFMCQISVDSQQRECSATPSYTV